MAAHRADECERLADSREPIPGNLRDVLREIGAQRRRLADDAEAHPKPPVRPVRCVLNGRTDGLGFDFAGPVGHHQVDPS